MEKHFLQVGDVVDIRKGMECYVRIPEKFVYSNRRASNRLTETNIQVGILLSNSFDMNKARADLLKKVREAISFVGGFPVSREEIESFVNPIVDRYQPETLDTGVFVGEYVVTKTALTGGGTGMGQYDVYSDGHHVVCKKLKDGIFDPNGLEISFYQSGSFTAMIGPEAIQPKRKTEMKFV